MEAMRSTASKARRVARPLALGALQLVAVLLLVEVGLRLFAPHRPALRALLYTPHAATRFEDAKDLSELLDESLLGYRPFTTVSGFVLNSRSLRTREYTNAKPPGVRRVLAIGDSFAFDSGGLPHRDHWPTVLERRLAARAEQPVEVLRLGVPGTGTQFQLRLWQLEGRYLDADAVVLAFFVGNDFSENGGTLAKPSGLADRVGARSVSFRLARNLWRAWRGALRLEPFHLTRPAPPQAGEPRGGYPIGSYAERFDPQRPTFTESAFLAIERDRMSLLHSSRRAGFDRLFAQTGAVLEALAREVREAGAELVVLIVPDEFQVDAALARDVARSARSDLAEYDLELPQRRLVAWLASRGIAAVDLLPTFRAAGATERLYQPRDTHWNAAGNALAAQQLLEYWSAASP
jgi:hypothetical protein